MNKYKRRHLVIRRIEAAILYHDRVKLSIEFNMGDTQQFHINKFDGSNYRQWKFQVNCALRAKGLLEIVKGELVKPNDDTGGKLVKWDKDDAIAMFTITSAMDLKQITLVENCTSSKEIIDKLNSIYEQKSEMNKMIVHERFHQYKMESNDSMSQHVAKVENLARQIKEAGDECSDMAIMTKILGSLPQKYRNLRQAWLSLDETKQTNVNLTARLLDEEVSLTSYEETETALNVSKPTTNSTGTKPKSNRYHKQRVTCYNCQKKGHYARDCRGQKKNTNENRSNESKNKTPQSSNMTAFTTEERKSWDGKQDDLWIMDSGASAHMTHKREFFSELRDADINTIVKLGNNQELVVKGVGIVRIKKLINDKWFESVINDVLFIPDLRKNLFSEGVVTAKGMKIVKENDSASVYENGCLVACAVKEANNLYRLLFETIVPEINVVTKTDVKVWHDRLGHINNKALKDVFDRGLIKNVDITDVEHFFCEACMYGKQHKLPINKSVSPRDMKPGEFIHSDLCGPMSTPSVKGANYFVLFKDDASGYRVVFFLKHKSDAFDSFKQFVNIVKNKFSTSPKVLHVDNGKEYINNEFKEYLSKMGIQLETTAPYTPEQNGRAERDMRTIVECARSMLYTKDIPTKLWAEAINTAIYILNRTPTSQTPSSTPYEVWTGKKCELNHVKTFGCEAYMHIPKELRNKLAPKSKKLIFVGYDQNSTNYRLYDSDTGSIKVSRNVIFNEHSSISYPRQHTVQVEIEQNIENEEPSQTHASIRDENNMDQSITIETDVNNDDDDEFHTPSSQPSNAYGLRDRNKLKMPSRFELNLTECETPLTYEQAVNSENSILWLESINEELNALKMNNTWEVTNTTAGKTHY